MPGRKGYSSVATYEADKLKWHLDTLLLAALAALEADPRHGYAVIEALRQDTGGRLIPA